MEKTTGMGGKIDKKIMKSIIKKFLVFFCFVIFTGVSNAPLYADTVGVNPNNTGAFDGIATEYNREAFVGTMQQDITQFESGYAREYVETGVPIEARIGIVFMRALTHIVHVLDISLVRFVNIFLIIAFMFWLMFEAYRLITDPKVKAMPVFEEGLRKAIILGIWLVLMDGHLQTFFGVIMGPIVSFGSYVANEILNATANMGGFAFSDTCEAIHAYATTSMQDTSVITSDFAADIMCVPSRLSGFYYAAINYGWQLMLAGLGSSTFTFLMGLVFVGLFLYTAFKFAFSAFGVIADLFLVVIMLPFTAIAETLHKTKYEGIAGQIYNGFLDVFKKPAGLSTQIKKFIDVAIYFVSFSIVIAIAGALLASAIAIKSETRVMTILNANTITILLTGILVAYIATHVDEIAKSIGGAVEYAISDDLRKDLKKIYNDTKKKVESLIKASKKSS